MKNQYFIIILWIVSTTMIMLMLYVFWWSLIITGGEWFIVRLNTIGEFYFEFIFLNCLFFYINFLFLKFYKNLKKGD